MGTQKEFTFVGFCHDLLPSDPLSQMPNTDEVLDRLQRAYEKEYMDYFVVLMPLCTLEKTTGSREQEIIVVQSPSKRLSVMNYRICIEFMHRFGSIIPDLEVAYRYVHPLEYDDMQYLIHTTWHASGKRMVFRSPIKFPINAEKAFGPFDNVDQVHLIYTGVEVE